MTSAAIMRQQMLMTAFFVMRFEFLTGEVLDTPRMKNYIKLFGTYNVFI